MSWFARSIVSSLQLDDDEDEDEQKEKNQRNQLGSNQESESSELLAAKGVKEDLSEITKTLTRQLWGVASFLAPPPSSDPSPSASPTSSSADPSFSNRNRTETSVPFVSREHESESSDSPRIAGIRNDFAGIGGRFRTSFSRLSSNKTVTEISKIASSFLPFGSEEGLDEMYSIGDAVGVTDEVLAFARNISMHPETWLDFPLFVDDEESDDFDMSDAQQEHALAVERFAPRLAALRIELCPSHMSEGCFWKIYFVLLHPRLSKHDAKLLSTPQVVEARAMLLQELQKKTKPEPERSVSSNFRRDFSEGHVTESISPENAQLETYAFEPTSSISTTHSETEKHPVVTTEMRIIDKSVIEGPEVQTQHKDQPGSSSGLLDLKSEDEGDDWLHEDNVEMTGISIPLGNEEDVSFSDLEDNDDGSAAMRCKTETDTSDSPTKDSKRWVQLNESSGKLEKEGHSKDIHSSTENRDADRSNSDAETNETNVWLSLDDIDVV